MRRDTAGRFTSNWDLEAKRRVSVTLTDTAWQLLEAEAQKHGISRSEVIERTARSFATTSNNQQQTIATLDCQKQDLEVLSQLIAAQEAERRVATILESITDAFVAFDRNWCYTYVNQAAAEILQKAPEELLGKHVWHEVFPELVGGIAYQHLHRSVAKQTPVFWQEYGEPVQRWLETSAYPSDEGIALYFRDITQQKQAEQALRQSEERLRFALEAAGMVAWEWNLATGEVVRSHNAEQLLELCANALSQGDAEFFHAIHPDDRNLVLQLSKQAITEKSTYCAEFRIIKPDGSVRWMFDQGRVICDDAGNAVRMSGVIQDITQRKQAEEALRESQALYQTLAEALPSLVWIIGLDGRLTFVNQHWQDALGVTIEQVNQVGWSLVMHPDDLPQSLENWARIQAGAKVTEREYRHRMADGSYRWFLARMLVMRDEQGQLLRLVGTSTDIDERRRTEDALRSSEERLALASQAAKVGTFEWNIQTNEVLWTVEEEALYGLPPGGFQGKFENWRQTVHPEDRDRVEQDVMDAVANRIDLNTEFRIIHPDGNIRWLAAKGRIFCDAGRPLRMIGMNEDITDRKQLEIEREQLLQQLEASLGQFEAVINSMSEGLLVSDAEGNVLLFNPAALVLHEYDSVEQVRRHLREFPDTFEGYDFQGNLIPLEEWPLAKVLRGETYREYEVNVHRLDTDTRWIGSFSGTPVYDKQGKIILAIVTMHDITERKQAEAERLKLLEQERTAREQAEAANRIKDEFLAVLSHELRTPLNPILGWSRLLKQGKLDNTKTTAALETIERNAKLQIQLIDDLLDISRILQGKLSLNPAPVDLKLTITAAINTVRLAAEAKSIQIQTHFASEGLVVWGDATRLQQIVWNLLSNAVKFTPNGGQIEICLKQLERSNAQITVRDTGKGIRSEFLPYVFDTFRQADSSTTRSFGGLGLGLSIVRHLVELQGGHVKVESAGEGQGTTFTVTLPLMPISVSTQQGAEAMIDSFHFQGIHVLAVDDDADNLELLQFILEQVGAKVITASFATEAFEKLRQSKLDLIVADVAMPQEDGYTLLHRIRELPPEQGGQIPAIALTAYAGEVNQQQAIAAGFQMHLTKPVDPEALLQAVSELLHQI